MLNIQSSGIIQSFGLVVWSLIFGYPVCIDSVVQFRSNVSVFSIFETFCETNFIELKSLKFSNSIDLKSLHFDSFLNTTSIFTLCS